MLHIGYKSIGLLEIGILVKIWYIFDTVIFLFTKVVESVGVPEKLKMQWISEDHRLPQGLEVTQPDDLTSFQDHHCYTRGGKMYTPFKQYLSHHP